MPCLKAAKGALPLWNPFASLDPIESVAPFAATDSAGDWDV
jgi:hypothetical protein